MEASSAVAATLPASVRDAAFGSVAIYRGTRADWLCSDLSNQKQSDAWCLPTSLSIVSARVFGCFIPPAELAVQWDQHERQSFDPQTMYARFRSLCVRHGMTVRFDYDGTRHEMSWAELSALERPMLWAFDQHAEVCIGTCTTTGRYGRPVRGYGVLNPANGGGPSWRGFPRSGSLGLDFAFTIPGERCTAQIIS